MKFSWSSLSIGKFPNKTFTVRNQVVSVKQMFKVISWCTIFDNMYFFIWWIQHSSYISCICNKYRWIYLPSFTMRCDKERLKTLYCTSTKWLNICWNLIERELHRRFHFMMSKHHTQPIDERHLHHSTLTNI